MKKHPFLAQYSRYCQAKQRRKHRKKRYNDLQYSNKYIFHKDIYYLFIYHLFIFIFSHLAIRLSPLAIRLLSHQDIRPYYERNKIPEAILDCYLIKIQFHLHNLTLFFCLTLQK